MTCYKDRIFCSYRNCTKYVDCDRSLNPFIFELAEDENLPICQYSKKPGCFEDGRTPMEPLFRFFRD